MVRKKQRYLLGEILYEERNMIYPLKLNKLYEEITAAYVECFGEYGFALVKHFLNVKYINEETKMFLVRIRRGAETMLSNVLMSMKQVNGVPVSMVTLHVSGSIRCAQKFWIRYNRRLLTNMIRSCKNAEEKSQIIKEIKHIGTVDFTNIFKTYNVSSRFVRYKPLAKSETTTPMDSEDANDDVVEDDSQMTT